MEIKIKEAAAIPTYDQDGASTGSLIPIYNVNDNFCDVNKQPQQAYITIVSPGRIKGPHLHYLRTGFFTCVKGNARFIVKTANEYQQVLSGEKHGYRSVIIPAGVPAAIQNIGDDEAYILNLPSPAWTPDQNDEHTADFSDFDFDLS